MKEALSLLFPYFSAQQQQQQGGQGQGQQSEADVARWFGQALELAPSPELPTRLAAPLLQTSGGPCGVLAAVQGFMIASAAFGACGFGEKANTFGGASVTTTGGASDVDKLRRSNLAHVLVEMLWRAQPNDGTDSSTSLSIIVVALATPFVSGTTTTKEGTMATATTAATTATTAMATPRNVPCSADPSEHFRIIQLKGMNRQVVLNVMINAVNQYIVSNVGVLMFLLSLIFTRTPEVIRKDMDDSEGFLTGQFGHCTQELMNLLLTGKATSQVHDGELAVDGGLLLRGLTAQPLIGYLSHLEALRYCTVGNFYKNPKYPVWVLGSASHYTVLFSLDVNADKKSEKETLTEHIKRAFSSKDQQENGYVLPNDVEPIVSDILKMTGVSERQPSDIAHQVLTACDAQASGVVLWTDFSRNMLKALLSPPTGWSCPQCTLFNENSNITICAACDFSLDAAAVAKLKTSSDAEFDAMDEGALGPKPIQMFHLNGLRKAVRGEIQGPTLIELEVTPNDNRFFQPTPSTGGQGDAFEETVNTKWPGCIVTYFSTSRPNLDG